MNTLLRVVHLFALALWLGSVTFFSFFTALPIIRHMETQAVRPNYWLHPHVSDKKQGVRLAGDALEPVFARYFYLQVLCGAAAFFTVGAWHRPLGRSALVPRTVLALAFVLACLNAFWLAPRVHELREERYVADSQVAAKAAEDFGAWHNISLAADMIGLVGVTVALVMAGRAGRSEGSSSKSLPT
jgi:hypothetical protein